MIRRMKLALAAVAIGTIAVGCSSTDGAEKTDPPPASDASPAPVDAEGGDSTAPAKDPATGPTKAASEPAPAPAPAATPDGAPAAVDAKKPVVDDFKRSKDGIDDDNPLPRDAASPALSTFRSAAETARTNPKAAVQQFLDAAGKTTYFYAAYFNAAVASEAAGDPASAEKYYREALKIRPDYGPALANLYMLLKKQNKQADADRVVDDSLKANGDKAGPHLAAATRAYAKRDVAKTEIEALETIRLDERSVPAMRLIAWVFFEQKRYESARFALENALVLEPGNALLHLELGHTLLKLKEERKALESFGRASKLRASLADAQENYGILLLNYGEVDPAVLALSKVVELRPTSAMAQLHYGNALRAQKKYVEAEAAYKKAMTLDANLQVARFNLGLLYLDNDIPGVDLLDRLKRSETELKAFQSTATVSKEMRTRIEDYLGTLEKLISREEKRRQREGERKALKAEKEADKAATPAADTPAEGATDGNKANGDAVAPDAPPAPETGAAPDGA